MADYNYSETEHERDGLSSCRFCAARSAVLIVQQTDIPEMDDVCFVRCNHCYAQGPATDREDKAASLWNQERSSARNK